MSCKIAGVDVSNIRIGVSGGGAVDIAKAIIGKSDGTGTTVWERESGPQYFALTAVSSGTVINLEQHGYLSLETSTTHSFLNRSVYYSLDNGLTWTLWSEGSAVSGVKTRTLTTTRANQKILFKCTNTAFGGPRKYNTDETPYYQQQYFKFTASGYVSASGDVRSLINFTETIPERCFSSLFLRCTNLTAFPDLLAENVTGYGAYSSLLNGCTGLTALPKVYAKAIGERAFFAMFKGCDGITDASDVFANTIESVSSYSFYRTFSDCTGLDTGAVINVSESSVPEGAFREMYSGCTSLGTVHVPMSSATAVEDYGFYGMFDGCTSLYETETQSMSATSVGNYGCSLMFNECENLIVAPTFNEVLTLGSHGFRRMFYGCTNLSSFGYIRPTSLGSHCCYEMFSGCEYLSSVGKIYATTASQYCFYNMFNGCHYLSSIEMRMLNTASNWAAGMFYDCWSLLNIKTRQKNFTGCSNWLKNAGTSAIGMTMHCTTTLASVIAGITTRSVSNLPSDWSYVADYS